MVKMRGKAERRGRLGDDIFQVATEEGKGSLKKGGEILGGAVGSGEKKH